MTLGEYTSTYAENTSGFSPNVTAEAVVVNYWALSLISIPMITVIGNMLVILSVFRFQALHCSVNYFIFGLALADLMVAIVVMPFAVYTQVHGGYWPFGRLICDIYCAADVTCSTASIFLLTVISFDRYIAATRPVSYINNNKGVRRVFAINVVAWTLSLCIACPVVLGLNDVIDRDETTCRFYNADFIIYSSIGSFVIPLIIILYLYTKIYNVIQQRSRFADTYSSKLPRFRARNRTAEMLLRVSLVTMKPEMTRATIRPTATSDTSKNMRLQKNLSDDVERHHVGKRSLIRKCSLQNIDMYKMAKSVHYNSGKFENAVVKTTEQRNNGGNRLFTNSEDNAETSSVDNGCINLSDTQVLVKYQSELEGSKSYSNNVLPECNMKKSHSWFLVNRNATIASDIEKSDADSLRMYKMQAQLMKQMNFYDSFESEYNSSVYQADGSQKSSSRLLGRKKLRKSVRKEKKATKTLAIVLGVFILCLCPFFTLNLLNAICIKFDFDTCQVGMLPFALTTWFGYMNSFMNPIIYTFFNIDFRRAFKQMLCCSNTGLRKTMSRGSYQSGKYTV